MDSVEIEKNRVLAIVRGVSGLKLLRLAEALIEGGVKLIEVAFGDDVAETCNGIAQLKKLSDGRMFVGAGTVTSIEQAEYAVNAGAEFILSPNVDEAVIKKVKSLGVVSVAGAMSPTEVFQAVKAGADYIKIFPAGALGADCIKALKAPFPDVKFIATAGVTVENAAEFFKAGASAIGVSGVFCDNKLINAGRFSAITKTAAAFVKASI